MNELAYQSKLNAIIKQNGGYARKWATQFAVGVPDCIWVLNGVTAFVEVKMVSVGPSFDRKIAVTPKQVHELTRLQQAGANALVAVVLDNSKSASVCFYDKIAADMRTNDKDNFVSMKHTLLHPVLRRVFNLSGGGE